ncbi:MAG: tetratricopeptide repeat protein [Elusimicrobiota bacterium]
MAQNNPTSKHDKFYLFVPLMLIAVILICYTHTLKFPFLWDDEVIIVQNPAVQDADAVRYIFKTTLFGGKADQGTFYRPLHVLSYIMDYKISALNTISYHITNTALHTGIVLLIWFLLQLVGIKKKIAFVTAFIFAAHPINTEAVIYISDRGDLLFTFFSLCSIYSFIKGSSGKKIGYIISVVTFLIALFSKETAVVVPFILAVYSWMFLRKNKDFLRKIVLSLLIAIAVGYTFKQIGYIGVSSKTTLSLIAHASIWERVLTFPRIVFTYIVLLVFPYHLHMEYMFVVRSAVSAYIWLGVPLIIFIIYLLIKYVKPRKITVFFLLWFFLALGPFYNLAVALASTVREHWVYFPSIGFFTVLTTGGFQLYESINKKILKKVFLLLVAALGIYYVSYTIVRGRDWSSPGKLYLNDVRYEPLSFTLHNNVGVEYFRSGNLEEASKAFLKAIDTAPNKSFNMAYTNLGVIYERSGENEKALEMYEKSVNVSDSQIGYSNLGNMYLKFARYDNAINVLKNAVELYPISLELLYKLAAAYYLKGDLVNAYNTFLRVEKIQANYEQTRTALSEIERILN